MGRPRKNPVASVNSKKVYSLDGMSDIICDADILWELLLKRITKMTRIYGFTRVETPLLEDINLYKNAYREDGNFLKSVVSVDSDQRMALRTSILPSLLRAFIQHKLYDKTPLYKWFYSGFVVSGEQGHKNMVSDYEYGFEVLGQFNHLTEAQVVGVVWEFLRSLGLTEFVLEINNIGKADCQNLYQDTLQSYLSGKKYQLCDNCNEHLSGRILNVFRCDNLDCQAIYSEAPTILDFLDQDSHKHFTNILEALDELGIPYQLNPYFAGPEGQSRTNFVIKYKIKDVTFILGEGGYHDELLQSLSGKNLSSFGFKGSLIKLHELLELSKIEAAFENRNDVFLVPLGELASKKSLKLFRDLTNAKVSVYDHFGNVGVKNQLKEAEVQKAPIALIMGQKEAMDEMVILRDVKSGMQEIISYDKIVDEVKKRLGR